MNTQTIPRIAYTLNETALALGCSTDTITRMIRRDEIRAVQVGKRRLIPVAELERIVMSGTNTTAPAAA
jgi:excisionase family DNA binding protein